MSPRLIAWLLSVAAVIAIGVGLYEAGSRAGTKAERSVWTTKQAELERSNRAKEQQLQAKVQQGEERYEQLKDQKQRDDAGARAELGRLRTDLAKKRAPQREAGAASAAQPAADEAAVDTRGWELFGQCAATVVDLAEAADGLRIQVIGLQDYVREVLDVGSASK